MELLANLLNIGKGVKKAELNEDESISQEEAKEFKLLLNSADSLLSTTSMEEEMPNASIKTSWF